MTKQIPANSKGRKSSTHKAAASLQRQKAPWPPPDALSSRAADVWRSVVAALPAEHFFESDLPLLAEYCHTVDILERIREEWISTGSFSTINKVNGDIAVNPTLNALNRTQGALAALAGKLRICPSSRVSKFKAGTEKPTRKSLREGLMVG